jgi:ABC-type amino acid transport system permease subunit
MVELMFVANDISFNNFRSFEVYGAAVLYYVVLILALSRGLAWVERRMAA